MTTCLNGKCNGDCDQGRNCPVRQQRIKEINAAYTNGYNDARLDDPYRETLGSFKELVAVIILAASMWLVYFFIWGKV
jgi:hypothetical protein